MSDYLVLNNYSSGGTLKISRKAIAEIVEKSVENLTGANLGKGKKRLLTVDQPLRIVLGKEGKIKISVQKEIATNLSMMIEAVPTEIHVHVAGLS